jgi:Predicted membrane protein
MSKYVFLGSLHSGLEEKLELEEVKKIVEYYEGYIAEAIEFGESEEEILNDLGPVDELIIKIIDGLKEHGVEIKGDSKKFKDSDFNQILENISSFSKKIAKEVVKATKDVGDEIKESLKKKDENTEEEIEAVINEFEEDIEEFELDIFDEIVFEEKEMLSKDGTITFNNQYLLDLTKDALTDLEISSSNIMSSLEIVFSNEETLKVEVLNNEQSIHYFGAKYQDGLLKINDIKIKQKGYVKLAFNLIKLVVTIPLSYKGNINLNCSNGKTVINGQGIKLSNRWSINCKNSVLDIKNIMMGLVKISTINSKINIKDTVIYNTYVEGKNGFLTYQMLRNNYAKSIEINCRKSIVKTDNGDVNKGRYTKEIPAAKETTHTLKLKVNCDNMIVKLSQFE